MLHVADKAPVIDLATDGGGRISLSSLKDQLVVVYFYPRDDTSGCTTEAKDFTALAPEFAKAGAKVIGISKDPVAKHDKFKAKYDLGVILASDDGGDTCERYGVWREKSMYGKRYMGIERTTFLIGRDGTIAQVWRKVAVAGHAAAVLAAVQLLKAEL